MLRTLTNAALFITLVLVFLPGVLLEWTGVARPASIGVPQIAGAGLFSRSTALAGCALLRLVVVSAIVRGYEEPTLGRIFGREYEVYCRRLRAWWPIRHRARQVGPGRGHEAP